MTKAETKAVEVVREPRLEVRVKPQTSQAMSLMTPTEMRKQLRTESKKRQILVEYIAEHFAEGTDYGKIEGKNFVSKDTLFKPGAEKFLSLFRLRVEYEKDTDTWEMLGSKSGTVCYLCKVYTMEGVLVAEGRGGANVGSEGTENKAIKIAQKRAKIDATLSTGGLSDFFTQDLEDKSEYQNATTPNKPTPPPVAKDKTPKQIEEMAMHQIATADQTTNLFALNEYAQNSKKLSASAKARIDKAVSNRVDVLENEQQQNN